LELMNKIHPSFNCDRVKLGEILPLDAPFSVILDASDICNLKCSYCFRAQDNVVDKSQMAWGSRKLMTWDTFILILEQISEFPEEPKKIALSGHGEPLVNKRLPDMVREIKKRFNSVVEIHTNATLLTKEYALNLVDSKIDKIIISLQGLSSEKYREICDYTFDFESFQDKLKFLYEKKFNTEINIKISDVALEEGEKETFIGRFSLIADRVFVERVVPIWENVDYVQQVGGDNIGINKFGTYVPYIKCCSIMFYTLFISPVGVVYPCTQALMVYDLGNVYNSSLVECWNSEKRRVLLCTHLENGRAGIPNCKNCYVVQNSIIMEEDIIDSYSEKILKRLNCNN